MMEGKRRDGRAERKDSVNRGRQGGEGCEGGGKNGRTEGRGGKRASGGEAGRRDM